MPQVIQLRAVAGIHPHVGAHPGRVGRTQVVGAVLEPQQVAPRGRGRRHARGLGEALLRPPLADDARSQSGQHAHRVEGHLRVVGAGLHPQVAAADRRVELVGGEGRQVGQRRRTQSGQPEPAVEQAGAKAEGHGQPGRSQAVGIAGVGRRGVQRAAHMPVRTPAAHHRGRLRPGPQQIAQAGRRAGLDIEAREVQVGLHGRCHARLMAAVEGDRVLAVAGCRRPGRDGHRSRTGCRRCKQPSAGQLHAFNLTGYCLQIPAPARPARGVPFPAMRDAAELKRFAPLASLPEREYAELVAASQERRVRGRRADPARGRRAGRAPVRDRVAGRSN